MRALAEQLFFDGNRHLVAREYPDAEACFREAVALAPELGAAHANLAWVLARAETNDEAEACYCRALRLAPVDVQIHLNYGAFLAALNRCREAEAIYVRAVGLEPGSAPAWSNLGALFAQTGRFEDAEGCCRMSMRLNPDYSKAHINLAYLCLRQGRFEEGWEHYDWRTWQSTLGPRVDGPRWAGEPLEGKSLLIGHEGGFGDAIQFSRYVAVLKRRGAHRIALVCPPPLERLFQSLEGVDELLSSDEPPPRSRWDYWTSLMTAPYHCKTRVDSIPATLPYLRAEPAAIERWKRALPSDDVRIGLAWKGNPKFENDAARSIHSLNLLAPLGRVAGATFVSLQTERVDNASGAARDALRLAEPACGIENFAETAALIANLDLVIAVDTAVAHLAGALGKPCWILLADQMTDWRWLEGRDDSPWYPQTVRLFRQQTRGDWTTVAACLGNALETFVGERAGQAESSAFDSRKSQLRCARARTPTTRQPSST
ncbi:MAG: tetratricopeptide repeat-containing glycosyltransferase family protein [Pseudomonadota bacterium]|nr:tetratricopeptide repeat-containing glycosyltransferase family protein [Pseudomonadota bacterium]